MLKKLILSFSINILVVPISSAMQHQMQFQLNNNNNNMPVIRIITNDNRELYVDESMLKKSKVMSKMFDDCNITSSNQQEPVYMPIDKHQMTDLAQLLHKNKTEQNNIVSALNIEQLVNTTKLVHYLDIPVLDELCKETLSKKIVSQQIVAHIKNDKHYLDKLGLNKDICKELSQKIVSQYPGALSYLKDKIIKEMPIKVLNGHTASVLSAQFSVQGDKIVSASDDNTIKSWGASAVPSADLSDDPSCVALAKWEALAKSDLIINHCKDLIGHTHWVYSAAFNRQGDKIVSASADKTIRIWDLITGESQILKGHANSVSSAQFNIPGDKVLSAADDIRIWDLVTGKTEIMPVGHGLVMSARFNTQEDKVVITYNDIIEVWDLKTGESKVLRGHSYFVYDAQFNIQGDKVASAAQDKTVRIWDLATSQCQVLTGHSGIVNSAQFNTQGNRVVSASHDGTIRIWDLNTGQCLILTGHTNTVNSAQFNTQGDKIVSASRDRTIRVWDIKELLDFEEYIQNHLDLKTALLLATNDQNSFDKILSAFRDSTACIGNQ